MKSLRELAEGKPCYLRLPGCSHDPAQTVLAHIRRGNVGGMGWKPPDVCGVPLDSYCHDVVDGRIKSGLARSEIDAELLRAQNQWLAWLWSQELLIVVAA